MDTYEVSGLVGRGGLCIIPATLCCVPAILLCACHTAVCCVPAGAKCVDALLNFETVALFGNQKLEVLQYDEYLRVRVQHYSAPPFIHPSCF